MTASGAAFNTQMGGVSREVGPAVSFLFGALNLRLGLWASHPAATPRSTLPLPGWRMMLEFFFCSYSGVREQPSGGAIEAKPWSRDIHVSDGGHFENLGLYELIRRHCRYIIVSDCGADTESAFDDLGRALRRIREDFGVEIEVDVAPLIPGPDGRSAQHMVVGTIYYDRNSDYDQGILLLFKPTLTGDEPDDVGQYKMRNRAFPHEATSDQFYDEAQWESYRRLGEHAARSAFRFLESSPNAGKSRYSLFTEAFWRWYPTPADLSHRMLDQTQRLSTFHDRIRSGQSAVFLNEISPELTAATEPEAVAVQHDMPGDGATDAEEGGDIAAAPVNPEPTQTLTASDFSLIMETTQVMEDAFIGLDLANTMNLPMNVGWLNLFHRLAHAETFQNWWPLVQPMFSQEFREFINDECHLEAFSPVNTPDASAQIVQEVNGEQLHNRAIFAWFNRYRPNGAAADDKFMLLAFMHPGLQRQMDLGLLAYQLQEEAQGIWVASWRQPDLFIAPAYRNINLAITYLPLILAQLKNHHVARVHVLLDESANLSTDAASRGFRGNIVRLYKSLGFKLSRDNGRQVLVYRLG
jgi:hypothetical protein